MCGRRRVLEFLRKGGSLGLEMGLGNGEIETGGVDIGIWVWNIFG